MTPLDCCGLLEISAKRRDAIKVDGDDLKSASFAYSQHGSCHIAVATGSVLTIATSLHSKTYEEKCEIELDNDIELVCWGIDAKCLIVGDSCGTLHFVTVLGELLFSHRVLSSKQHPTPISNETCILYFTAQNCTF